MTNTSATDTATNTQDLGEIRHLDPATLVLADNVRTDADSTITAAFVRSIAEQVRVPLLAYENDNGEVVVWDGQRRLLAAREAGLGTVPVYITSRQAADEQADTVERITGQVITADQRAALTQAQRVTAMRQLHLAGLSPTRIAKALHTDKRSVVDPALKAATSETALDALDGHALTLEQAAVLADYDDDPEATERLLLAAERGQFDYIAQQLADSAAERAAMKPVIDGYRDAGIAATGIRPSYSDDTIRLDSLVTADGELVTDITTIPESHRLAVVIASTEQSWTDTDDNPVDEDDIDFDIDEDDPDATPAEGYRDPRTLSMTEEITVETFWYVTNPAALGLARRTYSSSPRPLHFEDEPSEADKDAKRAERRQTIALNKKAVAATEVRRAKLTEWLARKSVPKGTAAPIAAFLAETMWTSHDLFGYNRQDGNAKSLTMGFLGDNTPAVAGEKASAERCQIINLAIAIGAHEADMPKTAWRDTDRSYAAHRVTYLRMLVEVFGHVLTDVEQVIVGDLAAADVHLDA